MNRGICGTAHIPSLFLLFKKQMIQALGLQGKTNRPVRRRFVSHSLIQYMRNSCFTFSFMIDPYRLKAVKKRGRKRQLSNRLGREGKEPKLIVICGNPIGSEMTAGLAAVNDGPFAGFLDPYPDRLHHSAATGKSVAYPQIHMAAPQTARAMIALLAPRQGRSYRAPAVAADEGLIVWGRIPFFVM